MHSLIRTLSVLSLAVVALVASAIGQSIAFRNMSDKDQQRWCSVMLPKTVADDLPGDRGTLKPWGWLWCRSDLDAGDTVKVWVCAKLEGGQRVDAPLANFRGQGPVSDDWRVPPVHTDWLFDTPNDAVLQLEVDGALANHGLAGVAESSAYVQVLRMEAKGAGFFSRCYVTLARGQDVFDVEGAVTWAPLNDARYTRPATTIAIRHGELAYLDMTPSMGWPGVMSGRSVIFEGDMPFGTSAPWFGAVIAEPDILPDSLEIDHLRLANAKAAVGGPIVALADALVWSGHVGPHNAILPASITVPATSGLAYDVRRDYWAQRPWANASNTNQTGDQGCFGAMKGLPIYLSGEPEQLRALWYSATDPWTRAHHFLGEDLRPLPFDASWSDPRSVYNGVPFWRIIGSRWGRANQDPPWGWGRGRAFHDEQHRGNLYGATALALTGSHLLRDELAFLCASDSRSYRLQRRQMDAPRAIGRQMQEWAHLWVASPAGLRTQIEHLADRAITICGEWAHGSPVTILQHGGAGDGKNPFRPEHAYWAPWQESFACDGLSAWAAIYERAGHAAKSTRARDLATRLGNSVVDYGLIETAAGDWVVCTYVRWNDGGAANDTAYYTLPREKAQTHLRPIGGDLVYGGIAMEWYSGAIYAATSPKAARARASLEAQADSVRDWEWLVR